MRKNPLLSQLYRALVNDGFSVIHDLGQNALYEPAGGGEYYDYEKVLLYIDEPEDKHDQLGGFLIEDGELKFVGSWGGDVEVFPSAARAQAYAITIIREVRDEYEQSFGEVEEEDWEQ